MNYFIDFEAAQYSLEIIEIGMRSDIGLTFEYLVQSKKGITPFIEQLTHITKETYNECAIPLDDALLPIYKAIKDDDNPHFICWGNSDVDFLKHSFKNCKTFTSKAVLSLMAMSMIDAAAMFKKKYGLYKDMRLIDVYNKIREVQGLEPLTQQHRALDDATMLQRIWHFYIDTPDGYIMNPFPEYTKSHREEQLKIEAQTKARDEKDVMFGAFWVSPVGTIPKQRDLTNKELSIPSIQTTGPVVMTKKGATYAYFDNLSEAIQFCIDYAPNMDIAQPDNIARHIRSSQRYKQKYFGFNWFFCDKETGKDCLFDNVQWNIKT